MAGRLFTAIFGKALIMQVGELLVYDPGGQTTPAVEYANTHTTGAKD